MTDWSEQGVSPRSESVQAAQRHPASAAFHALLRDAGEMHDRKQSDYGTDEDPFANVRAASEWGLPGSLGACIRINDKIRRLQAFYRKGSLANESVEDAFMDIAVYALIGLLLYREESEAEGESPTYPPIRLPKPLCEQCGRPVDSKSQHLHALPAGGAAWECALPPAPIARCGAWSSAGQCTLEMGHEPSLPHDYGHVKDEPAQPSTATCVLCHGFLANHGPNGECPIGRERQART